MLFAVLSLCYIHMDTGSQVGDQNSFFHVKNLLSFEIQKIQPEAFRVLEVLKVAASICFTKDYVYIVHKPNSIIPLSEHQWHEVYGFVFDRLRAVRQDMTIQQIQDSCGVRILEHATRIMIFANYRFDKPSHDIPEKNCNIRTPFLFACTNSYS